MKFSQRLFRFLIGVTIGVLLSAYFFKDKSHLWTSWLPGNRVKERIVNSYWTVPPKSDCILNCLDLSVEVLKKEIEESDVDFKNSLTRKKPMEYQLVFSEHSILRSVRFEVKDSSATILDLRAVKSCDCP